MYDEILDLVAILTHPSEEEKVLLERLCTAAADRLNSQLREGMTPEACGPAYACAAAWLAAADFVDCRNGQGGVPSFTAGSVSVGAISPTDTGTSADRLREQAWRLMAPYTEDQGFCFRGVKG